MKPSAGTILVLAAAVCTSEALLLGSGVKRRVAYRQRLRNFKNMGYTGSLEIGGQQVDALFDTGSFELLVRSTRCTFCGHPTAPYDRMKSGTYKFNGKVKYHKFASGEIESMKAYEDVSVGPFRANRQLFYEIVNHQIPSFHHAPFAAIVGVGPNFGHDTTESTLLMSFGVSEFSVCLQKASGSDGYITWGATVDQAYKEAHYAKARVTGKFHWVTHLHSISAMDKPRPEDVPCPNGCAVIVDSGMSLIAGPLEGLRQLGRQVGPVKVDCSNLHELPMLRLQVDGNTLELPPRAYVLKFSGETELDQVWDIFQFRPQVQMDHICFPAFTAIDMTSYLGPVWILGMPFLRYYHTTFDRVRQEMYFAKAGPDCSPQPSIINGTGGTGHFFHGPFGDEADGPLEADVSALLPPRFSSGFIDL